MHLLNQVGGVVREIGIIQRVSLCKLSTIPVLKVGILIIGPLSEQTFIFLLLYLWNKQLSLLLLKTMSTAVSDTFRDIFLTFSFVFSYWNPVLMEKEKVLLMDWQDLWKDWESCTSNNWISCQHFRRPYKIKRINSTGKEHCLHMRCSAQCWAVFLNLMLFMCCPTYCFVLGMGAHMLDRWDKKIIFISYQIAILAVFRHVTVFHWGSHDILGNVLNLMGTLSTVARFFFIP